MSDATHEHLFADLVFNERGERAKAVYIGSEPFYAVPEDDFLRHVEAKHIDRQIVERLQEHIRGMQHIVTEGIVRMLGQEDPFTRASIEHAIENMDRMLEPGAVDIDQLRTALWMAGFGAIVDVHGDLVRLEIPSWEEGLDR